MNRLSRDDRRTRWRNGFQIVDIREKRLSAACAIHVHDRGAGPHGDGLGRGGDLRGSIQERGHTTGTAARQARSDQVKFVGSDRSARAIEELDNSESPRIGSVGFEKPGIIGLGGRVKGERELCARRCGIVLIEIYGKQVARGGVSLKRLKEQAVSVGVGDVAKGFRIGPVKKGAGYGFRGIDGPTRGRSIDLAGN